MCYSILRERIVGSPENYIYHPVVVVDVKVLCSSHCLKESVQPPNQILYFPYSPGYTLRFINTVMFSKFLISLLKFYLLVYKTYLLHSPPVPLHNPLTFRYIFFRGRKTPR